MHTHTLQGVHKVRKNKVMREKKIKRKRGRIYCIYEGLTGGKLRKNLMFHMYTPLSINTLVQDRIKKKKRM